MGEVVLVHGAWHGAWCWDRVVAELQHLSVSATAVELPLAGLAADIAATRPVIEAAGPASVVVGHSYGGKVISAAAAGLPTVARLVYLAAFLAEPDEDTFALMGGSKLTECIVISEHGTTVDPTAAAEVFYGDADPVTAAAMVARLRLMGVGASPPPGTEPAWRSIPTTYVVCGNDQAISAESQRMMATRAATVVEWPTDHSPFVTRPEAIAALIASYVT